MADASKAQQLLAARKKLKEYQKTKKSRPNEAAATPIESSSLTNSTHSSLNEIPTSVRGNADTVSPLQNYFNTDAYTITKKPGDDFFDDFTSSKFNDVETRNILNESSKTFRDDDVLTMEYPEINPNEIYDRLHKNETGGDNNAVQESEKNDMETLKQLSTQIIQLIDDTNVEQNRYVETVKTLEEQVQCHQQTVNILVAEKSELSNALIKNELITREKVTECDELSARLKTSRSRVADLEKELSALRTEKSKHDRQGFQQNEDHVNLTSENESLKRQKEEAIQDLSELQAKLHVSSEQNSKLEHDVKNLTSQLSLLNVKLQQLSTTENFEVDDRLMQNNAALQNQIHDLHGAIKILTNERDQANSQYQQYVQQLNGQMSNLAQRLEVKVEENESLVLRERQLTVQMGELEKLLQKLQYEQQPFKNSKELEATLETVRVLTDEKASGEEKYVQVIAERDELFKELEIKKDEMIRLEEEMEQLKQDQPDVAKLLATIESDKVAASRAVTQNTELKKQLEEMQDVFIKMSNDKLELTEQLTGEQHKSRDLHEKLNQFESQIHTLTDAIEIKDRELTSMREGAATLNKYVLQQNQLEDRLRHYEAHDHSTHALQNELQESYKRIQNLKIDNEKLRTTMENAEKYKSLGNVAMQNRIVELERINKELTQLENKNPSLTDNNNEDGSILSKEIAAKHLEEKFTKTMQDIANLQDEKQRLEHLVLQLQSETETIGEYITLYQHQRGILKQRSLEREEQMKQLSLDRELMKNKLDRLNHLVKALLAENGVGPTALLENATAMLCTEHAQINGDSDESDKNETAEKIIELLSEIKTSNLVQPYDSSESFHPCPLCSGQLITV